MIGVVEGGRVSGDGGGGGGILIRVNVIIAIQMVALVLPPNYRMREVGGNSALSAFLQWKGGSCSGSGSRRRSSGGGGGGVVGGRGIDLLSRRLVVLVVPVLMDTILYIRHIYFALSPFIFLLPPQC